MSETEKLENELRIMKREVARQKRKKKDWKATCALAAVGVGFAFITGIAIGLDAKREKTRATVFLFNDDGSVQPV